MSKNYSIDYIRRVLTITKKFADSASDPNSNEYNLMMLFKSDIPDLRIVRKTHDTPKKYHTKSGRVCTKNQFKNLTYKNIEAFINALSNREEVYTEYMLIRYPLGGVQSNRYKAVREWFIGRFPDYYSDPLKYVMVKSPETVVLPTDNERKAA